VGAKRTHGPHQAAQKSTSTMPSLLTVGSNVVFVNACVAMPAAPSDCFSLFGNSVNQKRAVGNPEGSARAV
jgi:hypothetical protein